MLPATGNGGIITREKTGNKTIKKSLLKVK